MDTNIEKTINFLAKFLQVDSIRQPWAHRWKELKEISYQALDAEIFLSSYPHKSELRLQLKAILERMFVLSRFPELYGQHILCHIGRRKNSNDLWQHFSLKPFFLNNNEIPCIYSSEEAVKNKTVLLGMFNPHGGFTHSKSKEIYNKLNDIYTNNGELNSFFSAITAEFAYLPQHISYIDIPQNSRFDSLFLKGFLNIAHTFFISSSCSTVLIESLKYLNTVRPNTTVYVLNTDDFKKYTYQFPQLHFVNSIPDLTTNIHRNTNTYFLLKHAFQKPLSWFKQSISTQQSIASSFTDDILMLDTNKDIVNELKSLREAVHSTLDDAKMRYECWKNTTSSVLKLLQEMENAFCVNTTSTNDTYGLCLNNWERAEEFFAFLIEEKNISEIKQHSAAMLKAGYKHQSILSAGLKATLSSTVAPTPPLDRNITKINRPIAHRLCIHFYKELKLTPLLVAENHAAHIQPRTADEWYFYALWEEKQSKNPGKSLREAIALGSQEANTHFYLRLKKLPPSAEYEKGMLFLLRELMPEVCYDIAMSKGNALNTKPLFYLYIAAAQGHLLALEEIAKHEFWKSRPSGNDIDKVKIQKEESKKRALQLYGYLASQVAPKKLGSLSSCNFGILLHEIKHFEKAQAMLSISNEPQAYRILGRMYHYGDGVSISLDKAIKYYEKAVKLGDKQAYKLLEKAQSMYKRSQEKRENAKRDENYRSTSRVIENSSSSSSGCFLTTATCRVMGFEDDCEVLQAYREYRDKILLMESDGLSLVRKYYRVAPNIVQKIDEQSNSFEIYKKMWNDYLSIGYQFLQEKKYDAAKRLYIKLVKELLQKYDV